MIGTLGKWIVYGCLLLTGLPANGANGESSPNTPVILYTVAGCRPCRQALESLRELGIEPTITQDCPSWVQQVPTIHWRDSRGIWRQHAPSHWSGRNWTDAETAKIRRWLLPGSATKSTGRGGCLTVTSDSLPAPYYQRGPVTLYHGDCLELLPHLPRVDAVVADPPYGVDWNTNYKRFTNGSADRVALLPVANDDVPFDPSPFLDFPRVVLFGANCFAEKLPVGSWLIWDKRFANGGAFLADGEAAWMKGGHGVYIHSETVQGFVRKEAAEHPTQKPVGVMEWCLRKAKTTEGDLILDPFLGSGTTAVACIRTGRQCVGIELEEKYCEIAAKRCDRELDQGRLPFDAPKRTETQRELFAEVANG